MLKLRRSCGQTKHQASRRPEKHCPGPRRVAQHRLQAMPVQHHCSCTPDTTNTHGRFHSCSKGGLNNRGRSSLPKQSAAITGARKCYRCGRVSLAGAAISIIFVATKVLQRGPPSKELQIQELGVQKLQKKGTLTGRVQKQRHCDGVTRRKRRKRNGREKKETRRKKVVTRARKLEALRLVHNKNKGTLDSNSTEKSTTSA